MLLYEKQNLYDEKNGPRFQKYYKSVSFSAKICGNFVFHFFFENSSMDNKKDLPSFGNLTGRFILRNIVLA